MVTCDFTIGDPPPAPEGSPLGTPGVAWSAEQWASIAMASASDGWAIGTCGASGPYETFLLHYHGGAWSLYQNEIALP